MTTIDTTYTDPFGWWHARFRLGNQTNNPIYMALSQRMNDNDSQRAIVEVDAVRFLQLWRNAPVGLRDPICLGSPDTWPNHRKYHNAARGFSFGSQNPVPLAQVVCYLVPDWKTTVVKSRWPFFSKKMHERHQVPYLGFINGITRTIWLLSNGVQAFPVECAVEEAPLLHEYAGLSDSRIYSVLELMKARE